ncbi:tetratricopeptide repeat protein [Adhaeribacter aquaticus]|uniref:tetratricopeptide repeat protein n=1 Tax=Adhaeribacter aquaticus TaxID=299567 RepID=UPI000410BD7E|nr:tetratricopeptide repeat protein [Adhaeribacter aquaticus]
MKKYFLILFINILLFTYAKAQVTDPRQQAFQDSLTNYMLPDSLEIVPQAISTDGWLLMDESIKNELTGAVANLYNFKFDRAEKQFRSLRRRYPKHPMPYFLMGLSQWWKIMPSNITTKQYDNSFLAYMDTTITYGEQLLDKNKKNYEAAFFLAAANGFAARLHSERSNWRKATVYSRRSLENLQLAKEANGLSPEFLFGEGLYNYYAIWIAEHYPLLRPVIWFFPNGNKKLGLQQLKRAANYGFYTGTEAKFFLMRILANDENNAFEAYNLSRYLATNYPDNPYFQRSYARLAFTVGNLTETEQISLNILNKLNQKLPGYEPISGRYAAYFLGYIYQSKKDLTKAKNYYGQCVAFANQTNEKKSGYAVHSYLNLARISHQEKNIKQAKTYYSIVKDLVNDKAVEKEAKDYLKKYRKG